MADSPVTRAQGSRTQLGFGCSNLGSDLSYRASCALVEAAYDAGFRHFDVAPSYGNGQAERILGEVLRSVRDEVCLVTKVGIAHPRRVGPLRALKKVLLPVKRMLPGLWAHGARQVRQTIAPGGQFGAQEIDASIQESLARLGTTCVDWLLLHEVRPEQLSPDALRVLRNAVGADQVRHIGLGTSVGCTKAILAQHPGTFDVVQVNHFWGAYAPEFRATRNFVTHRVIREGQVLLRQTRFANTLSQDSSLAQLRDVLRSPAEAAHLLLAASLQSNGPTHILVASSKPTRIRQFMEVAHSDSWSGLASQLNSALLAFQQTHISSDVPEEH